MMCCVTIVIHVWYFRCITYVEIHVCVICARYMCNTHVLLCSTCVGYIRVLHMNFSYVIEV